MNPSSLKLDLIANQIGKSINLIRTSNTRFTPVRAVCIETGRARGLVTSKRISRFYYRKEADSGAIEGVRRGT